MDNELRDQYKKLVDLQGKVISWVGYDAVEERYIMLLNSGIAISVVQDGFSLIANPLEVLKSTLMEQEVHATQVMALKQKLAEQAYLRGYECGDQGMAAADGEFDTEEMKKIYGMGYEAGLKVKQAREAKKENESPRSAELQPGESVPVQPGVAAEPNTPPVPTADTDSQGIPPGNDGPGT